MALAGKSEQFVARCNIDRIVSALEDYGIDDIELLTANLESSFAAVQLALGSTAPPAFLAVLKAQLLAPPPPERQSTETTVPLVVTIKFNGKVLAPRTTLPTLSTATWEEVARMRLTDVLSAEAAKASARSASCLASCWRAAFAPTFTTTRTPACRTRCWTRSRLRHAFRGPARHASKRGSVQSSGPCSNPQASVEQVRRSLARVERRRRYARSQAGPHVSCLAAHHTHLANDVLPSTPHE